MSETGSDMTLEQFLAEWPAGQADLKKIFLTFCQGVRELKGTSESFLPRPGVSYSLRWDIAERPAGRERPLFVMADVVPLGEDELMLSVCFFGDEINDPDEMGNLIPDGMYGGDGYCFDVEGDDPDMGAYCLERAREAHATALKG
ncbi:MAG: hypothetical protein K9K66_13265 [Desulfarculaceae bacterium]|nr:hypothetical protein [Desulfarculaceae bacterium]MCF8073934.1 hypothetical protein [Desulfarculaceae bacterium]MCF8102620.1 hypothetical protein [Desulfarculaceae bacterium]MCF8117611.1 hypothetical protein [Desulfarculaceae bacterium]